MPSTQITHTLPKERWKSVVIKENNDPVVSVVETEKLKLSNPGIKVRKELVQMLESASQNLPDNLCLYVIEGVRSIEDQEKLWNQSYLKIKTEYPNRDDEFYQKQVGLLVAKPHPLSNHNCGGAVDVQLMYKDTHEFVDMGTLPQVGSGYAQTQMLSESITDIQKQNRTILRKVMEDVGFVWYPGEWWHYCYGDRMWAVYLNQEECFYGPIQDIGN